jgi:hypothetical protein
MKYNIYEYFWTKGALNKRILKAYICPPASYIYETTEWKAVKFYIWD